MCLGVKDIMSEMVKKKYVCAHTHAYMCVNGGRDARKLMW